MNFALGEGYFLVRLRHAALCPGDNGMMEIVVTDPDAPIKFNPARDE